MREQWIHEAGGASRIGFYGSLLDLQAQAPRRYSESAQLFDDEIRKAWVLHGECRYADPRGECWIVPCALLLKKLQPAGEHPPIHCRHHAVAFRGRSER